MQGKLFKGNYLRLSFLLFIVLFLLSGCVEKEQITPKTPRASTAAMENRDLRSYFPATTGMVYRFTGQGKGYASFTREVKFAEDNRVLFVESNGATSAVYVYEVGAKQIVQLTSELGKTGEKNTLPSVAKNKPAEEVILKNPIKAGTSWTSGEWKREIVGTDETVTVPAGTFYHVIKVKLNQKKSKRPSDNYEYYAEHVGLIMREYNNEGTKITGKLAAYGMKTAGIQPQSTAGVLLDTPDFALLAYQLENELRGTFRSAYESYINLGKLTKSNPVNFEQIVSVYRPAMQNIAAKSVVDEQIKLLRDYFTAGEGEAAFPDREVVEGVKVNQRALERGQVTLTLHKYFPGSESGGGKAYDTVSDYTIDLAQIDGFWKIERISQAE